MRRSDQPALPAAETVCTPYRQRRPRGRNDAGYSITSLSRPAHVERAAPSIAQIGGATWTRQSGISGRLMGVVRSSSRQPWARRACAARDSGALRRERTRARSSPHPHAPASRETCNADVVLSRALAGWDVRARARERPSTIAEVRRARVRIGAHGVLTPSSSTLSRVLVGAYRSLECRAREASTPASRRYERSAYPPCSWSNPSPASR